MNPGNGQEQVTPPSRGLLRWLRFIPNTLTLCNSLCGYAAILITLQAYKSGGDRQTMAGIFAWSAGMIFFAMVFDMFDGFTARLLHTSSLHGIQMDSLADMTTFGVAPATLVAVMAHNNIQLLRDGETVPMSEYIPICILCGIYLGCAALRLATYNVHAMYEKKSSDVFTGLPSPGAAAALCTVILFAATEKGDRTLGQYFLYLPVYAMVLGFLMVSQVPYPHFGKYLISSFRNRKRALVVVLLLLIWLVSAILVSPFVFPFFLVNIYVIWGLIAYFALKIGFVKRSHPLVPEPDDESNEPGSGGEKQ